MTEKIEDITGYRMVPSIAPNHPAVNTAVPQQSIAALIAEIEENEQPQAPQDVYAGPGGLSEATSQRLNQQRLIFEAHLQLGRYRRLLDAIQLRAYAPSEHPDDRTEQVVVTIQGVDVSIRGRESDLYVDIDSTARPVEDASAYPLVAQINETGENDYPTA